MAQNAQQIMGGASPTGQAPDQPMPYAPAPVAPLNAQEQGVMHEFNAGRAQQRQGLETAQQNMPPTPHPPTAQDLAIHPKQAEGFFPLMMALSALGGFATRQPMVAALNNMTAVMKGQAEGDKQVTQLHSEQLWKNFDAGMKAHESSVKDLEAAYKVYADTGKTEDLRLKLVEQFGVDRANQIMQMPHDAAAIYLGSQKAGQAAAKMAATLKQQDKILAEKTHSTYLAHQDRIAKIASDSEKSAKSAGQSDANSRRTAVTALQKSRDAELALTTDQDKRDKINSLYDKQIADVNKTTAIPVVQSGTKPKPTQADLDFIKQHPEQRQKFIDHFGINP